MAASVKPANQTPSSGDAHGQAQTPRGQSLVRPRNPRSQRFAKTHGIGEFGKRVENDKLDLRHRTDQLYLTLKEDLLKDLGDEESLSVQEGQLALRVTFAGTICETVEGFVRAEGLTYRGTRMKPTVLRLLDLWGTYSESERRALLALGLKRRLKDGNGLNAHLLRKYGEKIG